YQILDTPESEKYLTDQMQFTFDKFIQKHQKANVIIFAGKLFFRREDDHFFPDIHADYHYYIKISDNKLIKNRFRRDVLEQVLFHRKKVLQNGIYFNPQ